MRIKYQYGEALQKLLLFPGDWHILKNFQEVLMKVYYSAGLKEIAMKSGYRGQTLLSLKTARSFKRTHHFLLQAWEAFYRVMISDFFINTNNTSILSSVLDKLAELVQDKSLPETAQKHIEDIILAGDISHSQFMQYLTEKGSQDDTWQLWTNFLLCDCFAYIGLYVAIRGSSWKLRNASLKLMAPLFYAFDRGTYERIIPDHLSNLHKYPHEIIKCFEAGGFTVNINGKRWHSVAFDKAHEMCVNKDLKEQ